MSDTQAPSETEKRLVIQPNASLTPRWAAAFLASMCTVSFGIAGVFAWLGYWMVLPFAGLEMLALAAGLWWSVRDNAYREVVSVTEDRVRVEAGWGRPARRWEFRRAWLQVRLQAGVDRNRPTRLLITSSGRGCELGRCLTDEEREEVAERLRRWVRPGRRPGLNRNAIRE